MIALPLGNQSATALFTDRKSPAAYEPPEPAFDRSLKDAGTRLDQPKPTDRPFGSSTSVSDREAPDPAASQSGTDTRLRGDDRVSDQGSDSPDVKAEETAPADRPTEGDTPAADVESVADQGQATADVSATVAQSQVVSQILTPDSETVVAQANLSEQQAVAQRAQATAGQPVRIEAATALTDAAPTEPGQISSSPGIQLNQNKPGEQLPTVQTQSDQPSATAQRIELVSESRQNDSQHAGTRDSSQQQNASSNTDALPPQAAINATGSGLGSPGAVGDAVATVAQPSSTPSADHAGTPNPAGPSAVQQANTDDDGNDRINSARIARGLQNAVQQKGGSVTLRLTPPEMGTVRIQLQIHNGTVNAQFHAETQSTRTLLNQQISQLRASLEQQGLSVERLSVQTMQQSSNTNLQHESQSDRDGQPNDGRSRGGFTRQGGDRRQESDNPQAQQEFDQALNHAA